MAADTTCHLHGSVSCVLAEGSVCQSVSGCFLSLCASSPCDGRIGVHLTILDGIGHSLPPHLNASRPLADAINFKIQELRS